MTLASVIIRDLYANRPAATIAGRLFFATDTTSLYRDNGLTWDTYGTFLTVGGTAVKTANYTVVAADSLTLVVANSASAITITLPAVPPSSTFNVEIANIGTGICTLARNGLTIDGVSANITLTTNQGVSVSTDSANYFTMRGLGSGGGSLSVTAKGDLQTFASSAARLGVGSDATVLTADSTQSTGLKWAVPSGVSSGLSALSGFTNTVPLAANLRVVNQGGMTFADKTGRLLVTIPDSYSTVVGRFLVGTTALPTAPYTVDMAAIISGYSSGGNGIIAAIGVFDSGDNCISFGPQTPNGGTTIHIRSAWTAGGTIGATSTKTVNNPGNAIFFLRITESGTVRSFYFSSNGLDYILYGTEATNTGVTPVKPGMQFYNNGGGSGSVAVAQIYHFLVSNSILPQFAA